MKEIWKDVVGYKGIYQVSNFGRVKGIDRVGGNNHTYKEKILKPQAHTHGYFQVTLNNKSKKTKVYIHRIVLEAFEGSCPPEMECNHKNGNKRDNRLSNLEYCTRSDNHIHAYRILGKKAPRGENHNGSKLTEKDVRRIRKSKDTVRSLVNLFQVSEQTIRDVLKKRRWNWLDD